MRSLLCLAPILSTETPIPSFLVVLPWLCIVRNGSLRRETVSRFAEWRPDASILLGCAALQKLVPLASFLHQSP